MSEYTPLTGQVRAAYANYYRHKSAHAESVDALDAEFSRWLAAHDREVAAGALRDAADEWGGSTHGPRAWLRARADQIEKGRNDK